MSDKDENIIIEIELDDGKISKGFKDTKEEAGRSGKVAGKNYSDKAVNEAKKGLNSLKFAVAGAIGTIGAAFAVDVVTEAASVQEDAINEINTALRLSGQYSKETSKDFQEYASSLQSGSIIGDEVILKNAALIQNLGKLSSDALKPATKAALDMSQALGIDLRSASILVGKAAAGEVSSFSRYGVVIEKGKNKAETFANTLKALNANFGGAAASKLVTYTGVTQQFSNIWGDLKEEVGFFITKSPVIISVFKVMSERLSQAVKSVNNINSTKESINATSNALLNFGTAIVDYVVRPLEFLYNTFTTVFSAIKTGLQAIITGFASFLGAFADIAAKFGADNEIIQGIQNFRDSSAEVFDEMVTDTNEKMSNMFNFEVSENAQSFVDDVKSVAQEVANATDISAKSVKTSTTEVKNSVNDMAIQTGKMIKNGFARVVAGGIEKVTKNLLDSKAGFEDFSGFVLGIFGDLAIQLGTFFISQAIAAIAMKSLDFTGSLAAGAGLIALGTIMKSFGGESSSSAASPSVSTQSGGDSFGTRNQDSLAPETEQRKVVSEVNINGDILGDDNSALRIVELIQTAKDNGAYA